MYKFLRIVIEKIENFFIFMGNRVDTTAGSAFQIIHTYSIEDCFKC